MKCLLAAVMALVLALPVGECLADPFDEVNAQRANFGLPPLLRHPYLMRCAQFKAEFLAKHRISNYHGHTGHEGPGMGVGYIEGCGFLEPSAGWASCAMRTQGNWYAGAGLAVNGDGVRYMCLVIYTGTIVRQSGRTTTTTTVSPPEGGRRAPLIDTSHLTPNPVRVVYESPVARGDFNYPKISHYVPYVPYEPEPEPPPAAPGQDDEPLPPPSAWKGNYEEIGLGVAEPDTK